MAQHSNEHLTITELSAYLDKELTPAELALCDAHIQTCQPCQAALSDLRLTSALLSSMPQVAVPRSFVLPTNIAVLPETPAMVTKAPNRSSSLAPLVLKRTIRTLSTLAAILGLIFILAGTISALPHGGVTSGVSTASGVTAPSSIEATRKAPATSSTKSGASTPAQDRTPHATGTYSGTATSAPSPGLTPTPGQPYGIDNRQHNKPPQTPELPPTLNLGRTEGRLTIGGALLLLGILGVLMSKLFRNPARH
ncbi:MAG TPA: zf-HC2 domain-containing protein [Ktedonobacteraceae bacterium]